MLKPHAILSPYKGVLNMANQKGAGAAHRCRQDPSRVNFCLKNRFRSAPCTDVHLSNAPSPTHIERGVFPAKISAGNCLTTNYHRRRQAEVGAIPHPCMMKSANFQSLGIIFTTEHGVRFHFGGLLRKPVGPVEVAQRYPWMFRPPHQLLAFTPIKMLNQVALPSQFQSQTARPPLS